MIYTEKEIRDAARELGWSDAGDKIIAQLKKESIPDDSTTVTVREIREAWSCFYQALPSLQAIGASEQETLRAFLQDVLDRRGPKYKPGKIYRDAEGNYFRRAEGGWHGVGHSVLLSNSAVTFPVTEMP